MDIPQDIKDIITNDERFESVFLVFLLMATGKIDPNEIEKYKEKLQ